MPIGYPQKLYVKGNGSPCLLDLPKVYLVMHSDWEKNVEECINDESDDTVREKMKRGRDNVVPYVLAYYEMKVRYETQSFLEDTIDTLYEQFIELRNEFRDVRKIEAVSEKQKTLVWMVKSLIMQMGILRGKVYSFILENWQWMEGLPMIREDWLIRCESDEEKKIAIFENFKSRWIRELKNIIDTKQLQEISGQTDADAQRSKKIKEILELHKQIFYGTQKIYFSNLIREYHEEDWLELPYAQNVLLSMKYGASSCFNLEAVLCFLFCHQVTLPKVLGHLIERQEAFFDDIYEVMVHKSGRIRELFEYDGIDLEVAADNQGWELLAGPEAKAIKTYKHSLISLKELLILHEIIGSENRCKSVNLLLSYYLKILGETKVPYFSYDQRQCILSEFLQKTGMKKEDFAKLFNISPASVYRKCNDGTLYTEPLFSVYWMAVTGFTYDYLRGDTTLKSYGQDPTGQRKNHYLWAAMLQKGASEGILKVAKDFIAFKYDLTKKDSPYLAYRHPLWSKIDQEIDGRINKIVDLLAQRRKAAGHSINNKNNAIIYGQLQSNRGEKEKQEPVGDPLQAEQYQSFLTCLDTVVDLLEKETKKTFPDVAKKEPSDEAPK